MSSPPPSSGSSRPPRPTFKIGAQVISFGTIMLPAVAYGYWYYKTNHESKEELEAMLRAKYAPDVALAKQRNEGFQKIFDSMKRGDDLYEVKMKELTNRGVKSVGSISIPPTATSNTKANSKKASPPAAVVGATLEQKQNQMKLWKEGMAKIKQQKKLKKEKRKTLINNNNNNNNNAPSSSFSFSSPTVQAAVITSLVTTAVAAASFALLSSRR